MSMYEPIKKFELVPEGIYDARLIWLLDLGTHEDTYEGETSLKHRMHLAWELIGTAMEDGRPFLVGKTYNITNGKFGPYIAKTANLSKLLRSWQKVDEKTAGRISFLGGLAKGQASASITIAHEPNKKDPTKTNVILENIKAAKKEPALAVNPVMLYEVGEEFPLCMPDWAKKLVTACVELNGGLPARVPDADFPATGNVPQTEVDDDIPF